MQDVGDQVENAAGPVGILAGCHSFLPAAVPLPKSRGVTMLFTEGTQVHVSVLAYLT